MLGCREGLHEGRGDRFWGTVGLHQGGGTPPPAMGSGSSVHPREQPAPGGAAETLSPQRQSPPMGCSFAAAEGQGSLGTPRPYRRAQGGGGMRSSRTAATAPGGPHHRPPPISGAGGEAGAPAAVGAARTRVRGRDEADQRQTCRRRFIGDAQRLWRYVTSPPTPPIPPPGLGEMSGSPPHSPPYSTLTSSRHGSGTPGQGVWSQHMPGWCPPPLKKNVK